jgi:hypothetical protein
VVSGDCCHNPRLLLLRHLRERALKDAQPLVLGPEPVTLLYGPLVVGGAKRDVLQLDRIDAATPAVPRRVALTARDAERAAASGST